MNELDIAKQFGPLALFAGLVLYLLRQLQPVLKAIRDELLEMRLTFAAMLERDRIRDVRRKREASMQVPIRARHHSPAAAPRGDFEVEENTDIKALIEIEREKASKPRGERPPRKGTHHDGDE